MNNPWILPTEFYGDLIAIDMHTHINHGSPYDSQLAIGASADLEDLIRINRAAGIEKMFCSTFAACLSTEVVVEENEYLHDLIDRVDCLYQWVVIDPRNEETFLQAERMLRHKKCVGIKLHPQYHNYRLEEYADKIFSFAARFQTVVLIHPERDLSCIVPIANRYPNVTLIVAHLGRKDQVDAIALAEHGNVYTDTSGGSSTKNLIIEYAYSRIGADRILFGTDTYSAASQRGRIEYALIPQEDKQKILLGNAAKLFSKHL